MNRHFLIVIFWFLTAITLHAQDTIRVTVKPAVAKEMIRLRWAVNSPSAWYYTNSHGMLVERYTLVRDGKVLDAPEKNVLTPLPVRPRPLDDWQEIALKDHHAAIIAQALYGEDFEVSGGEVDISRIIALSQEQEQRYAMSMLAADMSYPAALFAGWGYEDKNVRQGERYLYRIVPVGPDDKKIIEAGNIYVGLDDYEELPRPLEADAIWGNGSVMVTWNYKLLERTYNTYHIERSDDGKTFRRLSETPLANLTGGDRMFFTDSITNGKTYFYRIVGLTSFGEEGPASDIIQGKGTARLIYTPGIISVYPYETEKARVAWNFDERGDSELLSFELRRSSTDKGPFVTVVTDIPPASRTVIYDDPMPENYFVVAAIPKAGPETVSFPFFFQKEDTIPPAIPYGLDGGVDSLGIVRLFWRANTDEDLLGYRVYRGQTQGEELIPLNDKPITDNMFRDTVDIRNLNTKVYYAVTALDRRYNQSALSEVLELGKPETIPPSSPFISNGTVTDDGILLEWTPGREALSAFLIHRAEAGERVLIRTINDPRQTCYTDSTAVSGAEYTYDVIAVSKGGLWSEPSLPLSIKAKPADTKVVIKRFRGEQTAKGIVLKWELSTSEVRSVSIYRKEGDALMQRWKGVETWTQEITDVTAKRGVAYEYMLVVKGRNGMPVKAEIKIK